uniref:Ankyrin-2 n=1 Tax=Magallana gigas TaxID=29159 RepID=K1Q5F9_MAGGI
MGVSSIYRPADPEFDYCKNFCFSEYDPSCSQIKNGCFLVEPTCTSPLHKATQNNNRYISQLLTRSGAKINLRSNYGDTALIISCCNGQGSIAKFLLDHGADINLGDIERCSPLYNAAQNGHDSIVELLLDNGADVNLYCHYGFGSLYVAIQKGYYRVVEVLLSHGADINLCSKYGDTPLTIVGIMVIIALFKCYLVEGLKLMCLEKMKNLCKLAYMLEYF